MYDVIIIGKGPAGISTSLYTQRSNLKTLVIGKDKGALEKADKIENYYGFPSAISGKELLENGVKGAKKIGVEILTDEVLSVSYEDVNNYKVITKEGEYNTKTLVFATGTTRKASNVENVDKFEGKGVSYCAVCDGFFYRGKDVADIRDAMEKQMNAERTKRAAILEAEGKSQADITHAEGTKQAIILEAEAERESSIRRAQGFREARILESEGTSEAIRKIADAKAEEIKLVYGAIMAAKPNDHLVAIKTLESLEKVAEGPANKVFIPFDATKALGSLGAAKEIFNEK